MKLTDFKNIYIGGGLVNAVYKGTTFLFGPYNNALTNANLSYNVFSEAAGANFLQTSPFSEFSVTTDARKIVVVMYTNVYATQPGRCSCSVLLDAVYYTTVYCTQNGLNTVTIYLPAGKRKVTFRSGTQFGGGSTATGTYINSITVYGTPSPVVASIDNGINRYVFMTDSIGVGLNSTIPERDSWQMLIRSDSTFPFTGASLGQSGTNVQYYLNTLKTAMVTRLTSYLNGATTKKVGILIGTNDYGNDTSAATYQTNVSGFLSTAKTAIPTVAFDLYSPIQRFDKTGTNTAGSTLLDFANVMKTLAKLNPTFTRFINLYNVLVQSDLDTDNLHPTNAGHVKYKAAVLLASKSNPRLSGLSLSAIALSPTFDANTFVYTVTVPSTTATTTVTASSTDSAIEVNDVTVASGQPSAAVSLAYGANQIAVGAIKDLVYQYYQININRTDPNAPVALNFLTNHVNFLASGSGNFTATTVPAYSLEARSLPGDGYIQIQRSTAPTNDNIVFGLDADNVLDPYTNGTTLQWNYLAYVSGGNIFSAQTGDANGTSRAAVIIGYYRISRTGGTVTLQSSPNGSTWTVVYTFTNTFTGTLYLKSSIITANRIMLAPVGGGIS